MAWQFIRWPGYYDWVKSWRCPLQCATDALNQFFAVGDFAGQRPDSYQPGATPQECDRTKIQIPLLGRGARQGGVVLQVTPTPSKSCKKSKVGVCVLRDHPVRLRLPPLQRGEFIRPYYAGRAFIPFWFCKWEPEATPQESDRTKIQIPLLGRGARQGGVVRKVTPTPSKSCKKSKVSVCVLRDHPSMEGNSLGHITQIGLSALGGFANGYLGRCPRLVWCHAVGVENRMVAWQFIRWPGYYDLVKSWRCPLQCATDALNQSFAVGDFEGQRPDPYQPGATPQVSDRT